MSLKDFLIVDVKDISNWIAILIAIPILYWGVITLLKGLSFGK